MIETIKTYQKAGLSCLPCKLDKSPLLAKNWKENFDLKDFDGVSAIGVKCGNASDGLICMDFDNHFGDAKTILTIFLEIPEVKIIYTKYKLPICSTQSGGFHLLFRTDNFEGNLKLARRPKWDEKTKRFVPDTVIETRGEGGYFCSVPSPGYSVIRNDILDIQKITVSEKITLYNAAKTFNEWIEVVKNEYESGEKPGDIYNKSIGIYEKTKTILKNAGWKEIKENQYTRPGKDKGVSATFNKAAKNIFYVFSSNGYPFEPEKGYSPFQVKALLEYKGDFSVCAKELVEKNKPIKKSNPLPADRLKEILSKSYIDINKVIDKPPVILSFLEENMNNREKRVFTLGNFSAITGKAKSKKTFFLTMVTAALVKNGIIERKFVGNLPEGKRAVVYFDTEQGDYDAYNTAKRVTALSEVDSEHFGAFSLREYTPKERCEIIEYALGRIGQVGFVVIDGIADLSYAINDEEEATRVVSLLLKWTKQYNCHIATVIHQNKNDNFATGHLGSSIMKKCEMIISITKDKGDRYSSIVECEMSRGMDFDKFAFSINEMGLPFINNNIYIEETDKLDF